MEKRIATISILIYNIISVSKVNSLLSENSQYILSRNGLPLREKGLHIITIIIESSLDRINALTGSLGRINDIEVKCLVSKYKSSYDN